MINSKQNNGYIEAASQKVSASNMLYLSGLALVCLLVFLSNILFIDTQFRFYHWLLQFGFEEYRTDFVTSTLRFSAYNILRLGFVFFGLKVYGIPLAGIGWNKQINWKKLCVSVLAVPVYILVVGSIGAIIKFGVVPEYSIKLSGAWGNLYNPVVWFYLLIVVVSSPLEEIFYRGFIQTTLENKLGYRYSLILTAGCYAVMHGRVSVNLLQHFMSGIFLGIIKKFDRSLWSCSAAHLVINILVVWFAISYH